MARPLRPAEPAASNAPGEPSRPGFALGILKTSRPKQWPKNVLVFAAPGAAGVLTHGHAITHALAAFALFCLVSSGTYFLNDSFDAPADRAHPVKRHRPVAAGVIPVPVDLAIGLAMMAA